METVAWVGAIETAIAILYIAIVGQRSIAQMIDDRRKQRPDVKSIGQEPTQEPSVEVSRPLARFRSRRLSVQRLGDYLDYIWREPAEALFYFAKGLMISVALVGVIIVLLLLVGALVLSVPAFLTGSKTLAGIASEMGQDGATGLFVVPLITVMLFLGTYGADFMRKIVQEERETQAEAEAKKKAEQKARTARRRKIQE